MKTRLTNEKSRSASPSDLDRAYDRLVYWLYERGDSARALSYAAKLEERLSEGSEQLGSIFAEECRSLINEAKGNLSNAIKHRKKEISLIRSLHRISRGKPGESYVLDQYGPEDLRDRLTLLAELYREQGTFAQAIATLEASKRYCEDEKIEFEANELLTDLYRSRKAV